MSLKATCPGCGAHASDVLNAVSYDEPCPHCGLPADAIREVWAAQRRNADAELSAKCEEALVRAVRAEAELAKAQEKLNRIRHLLGEEQS